MGPGCASQTHADNRCVVASIAHVKAVRRSSLLCGMMSRTLQLTCVRQCKWESSFGGAVMANFVSGACGNAECTGPPDPVYGDEKYRRIRVASQVCVDL